MIPHDWLKARIHAPGLEAIQARELGDLELTDVDGRALAERGMSPRWRARWEEFVARMVDGDELWVFESGPESWARLSGAAGYAIVRNGAPVAVLTSRRS